MVYKENLKSTLTKNIYTFPWETLIEILWSVLSTNGKKTVPVTRYINVTEFTNQYNVNLIT